MHPAMPIRFDPAVSTNDPGPRGRLLHVLEAALEAVDPATAMARSLVRDGGNLRVGDREVAVPKGKVVLLALGKASVAMARAAVEVVDGLALTGVVVAPAPAQLPGLEVIVGSHPVPDERSLNAGRRLLDLADSAGPDDLVLALVSGGGSALAEVLVPGVGLDDLRAVTAALLRTGAPITELNTVRRHLSLLKGGGLAAAAVPARVVTLVVSDVVGNPLEVVAGGPTVADPTRPEDALRVIGDRSIDVPSAVAAALENRRAASGEHREGIVAVIADGAVAARAAQAAAVRLGIIADVGSTTLEGIARQVGAELAASALRLEPGTMAVYAGETTVEVRGGGRGGRNQELALAAGIALEESPGMLVASVGTDGIDGPTAAAGGIGDLGTVARGVTRGLDARSALDGNDSATYLAAVGDQLRCGPTGTNVGDVMVAYRWG